MCVGGGGWGSAGESFLARGLTEEPRPATVCVLESLNQDLIRMPSGRLQLSSPIALESLVAVHIVTLVVSSKVGVIGWM